MPFDPKPTKYPFPMDTKEHYLVVKKDDHSVFDSNYVFLDNSKKFLLWKKFVRFLLFIFVFPVTRIRLGLRIKGRKNIRENKKLLKEGAFSCSNHIHMWDFICVMRGLLPFKPYVVVWPKNMRGENKKIIKSVGGIPVPDGDMSGTRKFIRTISELVHDKQIIHVCSEGSMWEFYMPIRPFRDGVAKFAVKWDKPVIPMGFSYRKPGFIRGKIFHQQAKITLNIGKPLFPNKELEDKERIYDLTKRLHDEVCLLCGIKPEENIYEAVYNNSKRIDYY